jgi:cytidylate kinase
MTANEGVAPAKPPVVTLWETYGCGMGEIGEKVAEALGVSLHQQAYTTAEIEKAGRTGKLKAGQFDDGDVWFLVGATGNSPHGFLRSSALRGVHEQNQRLAAQLVTDVQAEAAQGGVIMGRNGTHILRSWPNVLHVKLDGPVADRIARAAAKEGISLKEARERQSWNDEIRSQIAIALFDWNPLENRHYDLVLDTSNLSPDTCVEIIVAAARIKATKSGRS